MRDFDEFIKIAEIVPSTKIIEGEIIPNRVVSKSVSQRLRRMAQSYKNSALGKELRENAKYNKQNNDVVRRYHLNKRDAISAGQRKSIMKPGAKTIAAYALPASVLALAGAGVRSNRKKQREEQEKSAFEKEAVLDDLSTRKQKYEWLSTRHAEKAVGARQAMKGWRSAGNEQNYQSLGMKSLLENAKGMRAGAKSKGWDTTQSTQIIHGLKKGGFA